MKKIIMGLVVFFSLLITGCPSPITDNHPATTDKLTPTDQVRHASRAMDIVLESLVDPYERDKQKDKIVGIVEKTPELYEKPVQDFKAVIKASFEIIDGSFDNKTKEAAREKVKKAYDDGKGGGFKIVASIQPTEQEWEIYKLLKPMVYDDNLQKMIDVLEDLKKFYKYTAPKDPYNAQIKDLRADMYMFARAWEKSDFIQVQPREENRQYYNDNYEKRYPEGYFENGFTESRGKILDKAIDLSTVYYDEYIKNTYDASIDNLIKDEKLASDSRTPVLLKSIYMILTGESRDINSATYRNAVNYSPTRKIPLTKWYHPLNMGKGLIRKAQRMIDSMKPVREALDVMFPQ